MLAKIIMISFTFYYYIVHIYVCMSVIIIVMDYLRDIKATFVSL